VKAHRHCLVTGGAGFIGSHLTERLLADGHTVTVVDDLSTGSLANLEAVASDPRLRLLEAKVSHCAELQGLMGAVDVIFHLAAAVGVELVVTSPIRTIQTNLEETRGILEVASLRQVPVLLTSTSEVYGKSQKEVFSEDDDLLIGPPWLGRWSYACSKLMDEFLALAYGRERHVPVIVTRVFNTVGPRQTGRYGMVLPRFISAAQANAPLCVFGDGTQTRCFSYVTDTVEAMVRLAGVGAAHGQVVNVGGAEEIAIGQLAQRVIDLLESRSLIVRVPYHEAYAPGFEDMQRRRPALGKLVRLTGFRPATGLDEIIRRTAAASG